MGPLAALYVSPLGSCLEGSRARFLPRHHVFHMAKATREFLGFTLTHYTVDLSFLKHFLHMPSRRLIYLSRCPFSDSLPCCVWATCHLNFATPQDLVLWLPFFACILSFGVLFNFITLNTILCWSFSLLRLSPDLTQPQPQT